MATWLKEWGEVALAVFWLLWAAWLVTAGPLA